LLCSQFSSYLMPLLHSTRRRRGFLRHPSFEHPSWHAPAPEADTPLLCEVVSGIVPQLHRIAVHEQAPARGSSSSCFVARSVNWHNRRPDRIVFFPPAARAPRVLHHTRPKLCAACAGPPAIASPLQTSSKGRAAAWEWRGRRRREWELRAQTGRASLALVCCSRYSAADAVLLGLSVRKFHPSTGGETMRATGVNSQKQPLHEQD